MTLWMTIYCIKPRSDSTSYTSINRRCVQAINHVCSSKSIHPIHVRGHDKKYHPSVQHGVRRRFAQLPSYRMWELDMLLDAMSSVAREMPAPWGQGMLIMRIHATSILFASTAGIHSETVDRWLRSAGRVVTCWDVQLACKTRAWTTVTKKTFGS